MSTRIFAAPARGSAAHSAHALDLRPYGILRVRLANDFKHNALNNIRTKPAATYLYVRVRPLVYGLTRRRGNVIVTVRCSRPPRNAGTQSERVPMRSREVRTAKPRTIPVDLITHQGMRQDASSGYFWTATTTMSRWLLTLAHLSSALKRPARLCGIEGV